MLVCRVMKAWPWFGASIVFGGLAVFMALPLATRPAVPDAAPKAAAAQKPPQKRNKAKAGDKQSNSPQPISEPPQEKVSLADPSLLAPILGGPDWSKDFLLRPTGNAFVETPLLISPDRALKWRSPDGSFEVAWGENSFETQPIDWEAPIKYLINICPFGAAVSATSCRPCPITDGTGKVTNFGPLKTYPEVPETTIVSVRNRGNMPLRIYATYSDPMFFDREHDCAHGRRFDRR